ncbi:MAG: J domain-containing protein [Spirochaetaceae bacterium]|jgi:DnaJ-domain-containing protein 1|nr:J domain-containing protein [Spirochaetaceae bacterium]
MGIVERLSGVLKSYLQNEDSFFGKNYSSASKDYGDADLRNAFDELDDFLNSDSFSYKKQDFKDAKRSTGEGAWQDAGDRNSGAWKEYDGGFRQNYNQNYKPGVPKELEADFAELEVPFGADAEICKAAYKRLLKKHHPDRHAGHEGNMRKATAKSARINGAYERIQAWRKKSGA